MHKSRPKKLKNKTKNAPRVENVCGQKDCSGNTIFGTSISQGSKFCASWSGFFLHCFSLLCSSLVFSDIINMCLKRLSPAGDSRRQGYTKTLAPSLLLRSYNISTPSTGPAGNGAGDERFDVSGDLGSMSEIQQQSSALSRPMG